MKSIQDEDRDVFIIRHGLFYVQVCAHCELPPELVENRANEICTIELKTEVDALDAKGIPITRLRELVSNDPDKWKIAKVAPVQCDQHPERLHYVLEI